MIEIHTIVEEVSKRQLNMEKILSLSDIDKTIILNLFNDLIKSFNSSGFMSLPGGIQIDIIKANVLYNTLIEEGYLVTRREKNLGEILDK